MELNKKAPSYKNAAENLMGQKRRVTFYMDEKLHKRLNIHAVSSDPKKSMSQLIEELVRDYLERRAR